MTTQEQYIARLKEMVESRLGKSITTLEECETLSEAVEDATGIKLDGRAYAPLFAPSPRQLAPRPVVLSALARYVGMNSWSDFCSSRNVMPADDTDIIPVTRRWGVIILTCAAILLVVITAVVLLVNDESSNNVDKTSFVAEVVEERWIARTIEECNALRAYNDTEEYATRIASFIEAYDIELSTAIAEELSSEAAIMDIYTTEIALADAATQIKAQCVALCRALYFE